MSLSSSADGTSFEEKISFLDNKFTEVLIRLLERICDIGCDNNNEKLRNVLCRYVKQKIPFMQIF